MLPGKRSPISKPRKSLSVLTLYPWAGLAAAALSVFFGFYVIPLSLVSAAVIIAAGLIFVSCAVIFMIGIPGVGFSAKGTARSGRRSRLQNSGIIMSFFGAGLIIAGSVGYVKIDTSFFTGIPVHRVTRIEGVCVSDSADAGEKGSIVSLKVKRVAGEQGIVTSGYGSVKVYSRKPLELFIGDTAVFSGNFGANREKGKTEDSRFDTPLFFGTPEKLHTLQLTGGTGMEETKTSSLFAYRKYALAGLTKKIALFRADSAPLFQALFLGIKDDLSTREGELFRRAGCSHILALSGMHLGIITGLLFLLFRPLFGKKGAYFASALFIVFYIALTGFKSALLRAGIMFLLIGIGPVFRRKGDIKSIFLFTFLLLLILTPDASMGLSFQLSFLALGGILFITEFIQRSLPSFIPAPIALPLTASIGAQTATAPIVAAAFGTIFPGGILLSMIITPVITLFLVIGILGLLLPGGGIVVFTGKILDGLYEVIIRLLEFGSAVPGISIESSWVKNLLWLGPVLMILLPAAALTRQRKGMGIAAA